MKRAKRQAGMTLIGFLIVLSMVLVFAYLAMRIIPIYVEYASVVNAMDGVAQEQGSSRYTPVQIKRKFVDRLWVNYTNSNVSQENVFVTRQDGVRLRVRYSVTKPLVGNLSLVADFDRQVPLSN